MVVLLVLALSGSVAGLALSGTLDGGSEPPEPRPPSRPFFGLDVPGAEPAHVARLARLLGCRPAVVNRFVKLDSEFGPRELRETAVAGTTPMISLEPWSWRSEPGVTDVPRYTLKAVARGAHDAALTSIARTLDTHQGTVLVRFAHEMNGDWYPWGAGVNGNTAQDYVRAWRHVHDLMGAVAPRLAWVWSPVAAWWADAAPLGSFFPGDDYVAYVAASAYGHRGTAEDTFGGWYDEVRSLTSRPAMLSETGADGPGKVAWIASLDPFLRHRPGIAGFVWFNTTPESTGATGDYRIDDTAEHLDAFRGLLRSSQARCAGSWPAAIAVDPAG